MVHEFSHDQFSITYECTNRNISNIEKTGWIRHAEIRHISFLDERACVWVAFIFAPLLSLRNHLTMSKVAPFVSLATLGPHKSLSYGPHKFRVPCPPHPS